jgi:FtsP/CotA-like multicopper oxidase with cupredoxin domain
MPDLTYDVVALEFPIVYTADGDHDPSGFLYTLRTYLPLLEFARARWTDDDEFLPRMHERAQWMQLVVDGLTRYEIMRGRLAPGDPLLEYGVTGIEPPQRGAREQNLRSAVDEILAALDLLTEGTVTRLPADAAGRAALLAQHRTGVAAARLAIAERLAKLEVNDDLALGELARVTGLKPARVRRLLLNDHRENVDGLGAATPAYDRFNPLKPIPLVRPLVLRAALGQRVDVRFENQIRGRRVGMHLQGDGIGSVQHDDGAAVGRNTPSTVPTGERHTYHWQATHEGAWVINDLGDVRGDERGTNMHGLFGAFLVEPAGAVWRDPETGEVLTGTRYADGPYADIIVPGDRPDAPFVDFHQGVPHSHREFTVFFHDEPSVHSGLHIVGEHSVMPLSYRVEPMPNRLPHRMRRYADATLERPMPPPGEIDLSAVGVQIDDDFTEVFRVARTSDGRFLDRVAGEEQHHSSWLFGDPETPIFRAYRGDPARVRVIHAGVKETHVFHLHVHQWRAVAPDGTSQLLDSISIGPQTAITIDPLYGSGSRQQAPGDIIWHCHLYPHFHHGMWGLWRSFDRLVDGSVSAYPDGTPLQPLQPLPGRPPAEPTDERPGFPWFIDATFPQKAPPPPAVVPEFMVGRRRLLGMPAHSDLEARAFPPGVVANPRPGAVFVDLDGDAARWNAEAGLPAPRVISYDVDVDAGEVVYNSRGWRDPQGHRYRVRRVTVDGVEFDPPADAIEPFFPRANHGDIVEWRMFNNLRSVGADGFDLPTPPAECGLHVHLVKFDVLAADGSSTGFNYLSGASCPETMTGVEPGPLPANVTLHRWVVDEEFGPCFFHDHLLANYRQKHGLFAALIAEPHGSRWLRPDQEGIAWSGIQAVVLPPLDSGLPAYREACLAVGDFVPLVDAAGRPLNPPGELGGDDDPGLMAVNYRNSPLTFRSDDPSEWFAATSRAAEPEEPADRLPVAATGDPDTEMIRTYPGDRLRIRLIQGSHEEQHSFVAHGLRWHREWRNPASDLVNQQTIGISEAFTLDLDPYGTGDHLWHFTSMDDLWLGCWGLLRALPPSVANLRALPPLPGRRGLDPALPPRPRVADREYVVSARRVEHEYDGRHLTDPWGLVFETADGWIDEDEGRRAYGVHRTGEPLVLRARARRVDQGHPDQRADPGTGRWAGDRPARIRRRAQPAAAAAGRGGTDRLAACLAAPEPAAVRRGQRRRLVRGRQPRQHGAQPAAGGRARRRARRGHRQGGVPRRRARRPELAGVLVVRRRGTGRPRLLSAGHGGRAQPPAPRPDRRAGGGTPAADPGRPAYRRRVLDRHLRAAHRRPRRGGGQRAGAAGPGRAAALRGGQPDHAGAGRRTR